MIGEHPGQHAVAAHGDLRAPGGVELADGFLLPVHHLVVVPAGVVSHHAVNVALHHRAVAVVPVICLHRSAGRGRAGGGSSGLRGGRRGSWCMGGRLGWCRRKRSGGCIRHRGRGLRSRRGWGLALPAGNRAGEHEVVEVDVHLVLRAELAKGEEDRAAGRGEGQRHLRPRALREVGVQVGPGEDRAPVAVGDQVGFVQCVRYLYRLISASPMLNRLKKSFACDEINNSLDFEIQKSS